MAAVSTRPVRFAVAEIGVGRVDETQLLARDLLDPGGVELPGPFELEGFDLLLELADPPVGAADVESELDRFGLVPDVERQDADDGDGQRAAGGDALEVPFPPDHQILSAARSLAERA